MLGDITRSPLTRPHRHTHTTHTHIRTHAHPHTRTHPVLTHAHTRARMHKHTHACKTHADLWDSCTGRPAKQRGTWGGEESETELLLKPPGQLLRLRDGTLARNRVAPHSVASEVLVLPRADPWWMPDKCQVVCCDGARGQGQDFEDGKLTYLSN